MPETDRQIKQRHFSLLASGYAFSLIEIPSKKLLPFLPPLKSSGGHFRSFSLPTLQSKYDGKTVFGTCEISLCPLEGELGVRGDLSQKLSKTQIFSSIL